MIHPPTHVSRTNALSLHEVLHRLERRDVVDGVILVGSTGAGMLTEVSDYDLYIVLSSIPAPLQVGLDSL
jgi:predicted nucleotidyltransferase